MARKRGPDLVASAGHDVEHAGWQVAVAIRAISRTASGASADGLRTIVFPAASAGAILWAASDTGAFQGTIAATTPHGSRRV